MTSGTSVFADASKGNLSPDKSESAIAYVVMLSDGYNKNRKSSCCLLSWASRKAKRVVSSTFDAEALALNTGLQAGLVMKAHLIEIMNWTEDMVRVEGYTDCNDVYQAIVKNNKPEKGVHAKGDQLSCLDIAAVRKYMQQGIVHDVDWVPSGNMLSDPLTKMGASPEALVKAITTGEF